MFKVVGFKVNNCYRLSFERRHYGWKKLFIKNAGLHKKDEALGCRLRI
jgi:hypothetical protein